MGKSQPFEKPATGEGDALREVPKIRGQHGVRYEKCKRIKNGEKIGAKKLSVHFTEKEGSPKSKYTEKTPE